MRLHESGEMYLETILILSQRGAVRSLDVAEYMHFSKPSVSRAVSLLKNGGFIIVDKNGFIELTDAGRGLPKVCMNGTDCLHHFLLCSELTKKRRLRMPAR